MKANGTRAQPWYREPWPWILMAGPALVVVAGLVTAWLAVRSDDGLVADDYYKQGLAINRTLGRTDAAKRLGITAEIRLVNGRVRVLLGVGARGELELQLAHPTRAGMDQKIKLSMIEPGVYEGRLQPLRAGRWHVILEQSDWRLTGDWKLPAEGALTLGAGAPSPAVVDTSTEGKQ